MGLLQARFAAGLRRLRPEFVNAIATAERFEGLPADLLQGRILAAFKRAAPSLGIAPRLRDAIDVLMAYSQPQDWEAGSRPIVWPSNITLQEQLGLCRRQVQYLIRSLIDERLIVPIDSPTGRRWGHRHPVTGKIIEAYGFDLSPLAVRYNEFVAAAERAHNGREAQAKLRRRLTIARKAIRQIAEAADEASLGGRDWQQWAEDAVHIAETLSADTPFPILEKTVADLENRRRNGEAVLKAAFLCEDSEESAPSDALDCTPITTTKELPADKSATGNPSLKPVPRRTTSATPTNASTREEKESPKNRVTEIQEHSMETITPRLILTISPPLKPYILNQKPNWSDIINAADWVRSDLGISRYAWIEACESMGRTAAATAVAIIAAKSKQIRSAGGYLRAMSGRAREGTLHLSKSIHGLSDRQQRTPP